MAGIDPAETETRGVDKSNGSKREEIRAQRIDDIVRHLAADRFTTLRFALGTLREVARLRGHRSVSVKVALFSETRIPSIAFQSLPRWARFLAPSLSLALVGPSSE